MAQNNLAKLLDAMEHPRPEEQGHLLHLRRLRARAHHLRAEREGAGAINGRVLDGVAEAVGQMPRLVKTPAFAPLFEVPGRGTRTPRRRPPTTPRPWRFEGGVPRVRGRAPRGRGVEAHADRNRGLNASGCENRPSRSLESMSRRTKICARCTSSASSGITRRTSRPRRRWRRSART